MVIAYTASCMSVSNSWKDLFKSLFVLSSYESWLLKSSESVSRKYRTWDMGPSFLLNGDQRFAEQMVQNILVQLLGHEWEKLSLDNHTRDKAKGPIEISYIFKAACSTKLCLMLHNVK